MVELDLIHEDIIFPSATNYLFEKMLCVLTKFLKMNLYNSKLALMEQTNF